MTVLYLFSNRTMAKVFLLLKACSNGLWLGTLKEETLHEIDAIYYDDQKKIYCNEKYNKSGLRDWEMKVIDRYFGKGTRVLVAGVGGGREMLALHRLGFVTDGFECHPDLRSYANELLEKEGFVPNVMLAPRDHCPDSDTIYDGVIVGWGAYMLIQGRSRRIDFLKKLRTQTRENSPILISFFVRPYDGLYLKLITAIGNALRWCLRRRRLELGDDLVPNYVHHFTEKEVAVELRESGFCLDCFCATPYGHAVGFASSI